jgi:hypothetical protein
LTHQETDRNCGGGSDDLTTVTHYVSEPKSKVHLVFFAHRIFVWKAGGREVRSSYSFELVDWKKLRHSVSKEGCVSDKLGADVALHGNELIIFVAIA